MCKYADGGISFINSLITYHKQETLHLDLGIMRKEWYLYHGVNSEPALMADSI